MHRGGHQGRDSGSAYINEMRHKPLAAVAWKEQGWAFLQVSDGGKAGVIVRNGIELSKHIIERNPKR